MVSSNGKGASKSKDYYKEEVDSIGNCDHPWVLATEGRDGYCIAITNIALEVNEGLWEDEYVALLEDLGDEAVIWVGGDEASLKGTIDDGQYLSCTGVKMGSNDTRWCIVYADHGDAKGVESWNLGCSDRGHSGPNWVRCVARYVEPREEEIIGLGELGILAN
ncbi:hypothetical protein CKAN_01463400 [Cinnamomum micranthum f. kanehirae]|uniref:Uncharacterized protein n=1 Tax=Cinnamomum micranthum f. kanehirae TaxID=337451 RepID=A0A443P4S8_9MAGN|nr:hypothetical protein CKAN_01463400 [Cinnamomum micranthum f. kanehirae]